MLLFLSLLLYVSATLAQHYHRSISKAQLIDNINAVFNWHLIDVPPLDPAVDVAAARVHPPLLGNAPAPVRFIMTRCPCRPNHGLSLVISRFEHPRALIVIPVLRYIVYSVLSKEKRLRYLYIFNSLSLIVGDLRLLLCQRRLGCVIVVVVSVLRDVNKAERAMQCAQWAGMLSLSSSHSSRSYFPPSLCDS